VNRTTLAAPVRVPGSGREPCLFTDASASIEIRPAESGGIRFELSGQLVSADIDRLDTRPAQPVLAKLGSRHTALAASADAPAVFTVEHVLGALTGVGVTEAVVSVESDSSFEVPIFDGSAKPFVDAIESVGRRELATPLAWARLSDTVEVVDEDAFVRCEPCEPADAAFTYELSYANTFLGNQSATWLASDRDTFVATVAPARTFSLEHEAKLAQAAGLFQGFTPADLLVIGDKGPIENELLFPNEPAAHKLLDLVGDLSLASGALGSPIAMRVTARKSGHALHHRAAREIVGSIKNSGW